MKIAIGKTLITAVMALGIANGAWAQGGDKGAAPAGKKMADGFTLMPSGLEYKIIKHGDGKRKAANGDHAELFIHVFLEDSSIFDSRKMYNATKPVPVTIQTPKTNGDLMEGFLMLAAGDSALFRVPVDSMRKAGMPSMPGMKENSGQKVKYEVQLVSIRSDEEEKKYNQEQAAKQVGIDESALADYFKKNGIKATKTASGLYYTVTKEGSGPKPKAGQMLSVNYTGKLLDGKVFDSNTDSAFHHMEPFKLPIGKGNVIKGWDEGLLLYNKGAKGTLYIPSTLAYGSQDRSPQIPANSVLVFDVELLDIEDAPAQAAGPTSHANCNSAELAKADDKALQEYFTKNKIKATKTASGLYYAISQKGDGPTVPKGKKVSMNYTGKTLDGKTFDSNVDPKFNHVTPFAFTLGAGQVIKGWDEGVALLQKGTKGTLFIPSGLGYGCAGAGGAIPPHAVLMFDVEVLSYE